MTFRVGRHWRKLKDRTTWPMVANGSLLDLEYNKFKFSTLFTSQIYTSAASPVFMSSKVGPRTAWRCPDAQMGVLRLDPTVPLSIAKRFFIYYRQRTFEHYSSPLLHHFDGSANVWVVRSFWTGLCQLRSSSFDRVTIWESSHRKVHRNLHSPDPSWKGARVTDDVRLSKIQCRKYFMGHPMG